MRAIRILILAALPVALLGCQSAPPRRPPVRARTARGEPVLLHADGTWQSSPENVPSLID